VKNKASGELERTMQGTYARLVEMAETRAIEREDLQAELEQIENALGRSELVVGNQDGLIIQLKADVRDLEALVELAATPDQVPRAPDIVLIEDPAEGFSAALGTVQEACGHLAERGVNQDKPCMRARENPERTHAKGRHRY